MLKNIAFKAYRDEAVEIRTETYMGRDWMVVPVVALVEGVLQGMNSPFPELALASEFGRVVDGWNGRPLVMNHPVVDGIPVTANSPAVLEQYSFGLIFNSRIEDAKLKVDAFIDLERAEKVGGEIAEMVERLNKGETVEVSTGLYSSIEEVSGKFNGRDYQGVWRNVVPDHLAFLSAGVKGACSVEDGCGTPRINQAAAGATQTDTPVARWNSYTQTGEVTMTTASTPEIKVQDCGCGCGGKCKDGEHSHDSAPAVLSIKVETVALQEGQTIKTFTEGKAVFSVQQLIANALPDGIFSQDVRVLLNHALESAGHHWSYVLGFTLSKVIYEDYEDSIGYAVFQRSYTISDSKDVTLGDDREQVLLLTEIKPAAAPGGVKVNASSDETTETTVTTEGDDDMTTAATAGSTPAATEENTPAPAPAPVVNSSTPVVTEPKIKTQAEVLAEMPDGMREVMEAGLKLHAQKKGAIIKALKDTGRCKFSDEQLDGMKLDMLEQLAELSQIPATYAGVAAPVQPASLVDNAANDIPPMPEAFPVKKAEAA